MINHSINPRLSAPVQDQLEKLYEEATSDEMKNNENHERYGDEEVTACEGSKEERATEFDRLL